MSDDGMGSVGVLVGQSKWNNCLHICNLIGHESRGCPLTITCACGTHGQITQYLFVINALCIFFSFCIVAYSPTFIGTCVYFIIVRVIAHVIYSSYK